MISVCIAYFYAIYVLYEHRSGQSKKECSYPVPSIFDILLGNANAISGEVRNPVEIAAAPTTHDSSVSRRVSTSTSRLWSLKAATLSLLIRERPENATVDEMLARAIAATRFMVQ